MNDREWLRPLATGELPVHKPTAAIVYLRGASEEIEQACTLAAREYADILKLEVSIIPAADGTDMIAAAKWFARRGVHRLALLGFGTPETFLLPSSGGIHRWRDTGTHWISAKTFASHWAPMLTEGAIVSLGADLCSRSPHWYLGPTTGQLLSPWCATAYGPGGQYSLAAWLAHCLGEKREHVEVRGHTTVGHCIDSPFIRAHWHGCELGVSLWQLVMQTTRVPTLRERHRWQLLIAGKHARRYLLGISDAKALQSLRSQFHRTSGYSLAQNTA